MSSASSAPAASRASGLALRPLPRRFFARDAPVVAPELLGKVLVLGPCRARLVEVEAYAGGEDPGSHADSRRHADPVPLAHARLV